MGMDALGMEVTIIGGWRSYHGLRGFIVNYLPPLFAAAEPKYVVEFAHGGAIREWAFTADQLEV